MALRRVCAPATIHTRNMGILSGLHRGDKKCIGPKAKEADPWIKNMGRHRKVQDEGIKFDVTHEKAHRTLKEAKTTLFEKFVMVRWR